MANGQLSLLKEKLSTLAVVVGTMKVTAVAAMVAAMFFVSKNGGNGRCGDGSGGKVGSGG